MHKKHFLTTLLSFVVMLAACQKEKKTEPVPEPTPPEVPKLVVASASIASVQMLEDCPDPKAAAGAPASPKAQEAEQAPAKRRAPAESMPASIAPSSDSLGPGAVGNKARYAPPCQQSTMQVSFAGQGPSSSKVVLKELRLLTPDGKSLGILKARLPTVWDESVYAPWDEVVQAGKDINVSYKITPPNWGEVEGVLGSPSHGKMFVLEADVEVGGETQTVRSIQFTRIQPQMMPT